MKTKTQSKCKQKQIKGRSAKKSKWIKINMIRYNKIWWVTTILSRIGITSKWKLI